MAKNTKVEKTQRQREDVEAEWRIKQRQRRRTKEGPNKDWEKTHKKGPNKDREKTHKEGPNTKFWIERRHRDNTYQLQRGNT